MNDREEREGEKKKKKRIGNKAGGGEIRMFCRDNVSLRRRDGPIGRIKKMLIEVQRGTVRENKVSNEKLKGC